MQEGLPHHGSDRDSDDYPTLPYRTVPKSAKSWLDLEARISEAWSEYPSLSAAGKPAA